MLGIIEDSEKHAISHKKGGKPKKFFLKIRAKKRLFSSDCCSCRKVLCILHHLLVNQELYEEEGGAIQKDTLILKNDQKVPPIEDMIRYKVQA